MSGKAQTWRYRVVCEYCWKTVFDRGGYSGPHEKTDEAPDEAHKAGVEHAQQTGHYPVVKGAWEPDSRQPEP